MASGSRGRRARLANRLRAHAARLGGRPQVAGTLPEPLLLGDAERGQALVDGRWRALGTRVETGKGSIWQAPLPDPRLEAERQACPWLDDLAALGNRGARGLAQAWVQDWITRYGRGRGPGWQPELAGPAGDALDGERGAADRGPRRGFGRPLLAGAGGAPALPRGLLGAGRAGTAAAGALAGLVWSGLVLPHRGHAAALAEMAALAEAMVDAEGGTPSRAPEDLAEILILLIWTARLLEDAGQHAMAPHLRRSCARCRRSGRSGSATAAWRASRAAAPARRSASTRRSPSCG